MISLASGVIENPQGNFMSEYLISVATRKRSSATFRTTSRPRHQGKGSLTKQLSHQRSGVLYFINKYIYIFIYFFVPGNLQNLIFAKYGRWRPLETCKMLPRGVGSFCPPGKDHSGRKKSLDFFRPCGRCQVSAISSCAEFNVLFGLGFAEIPTEPI